MFVENYSTWHVRVSARNVILYGEQEQGTDKSTFLKSRFTDARFKLLQTIILL